MIRPAALCALAFAVVLPVFAGCDQDTFLGGKWESSLVPGEQGSARQVGLFLGVCKDDDVASAALPEPCEVFPQLVLGHYGEDVVGLMTWSSENIASEAVACTLTAAATMPCSRVDTRYREPNFLFDLYLCDGNRRVTVTRISSSEIELSIAPDRRVDHGCENATDCVPMVFRLRKTADESELSGSDKDEAACEPKPPPSASL